MPLADHEPSFVGIDKDNEIRRDRALKYVLAVLGVISVSLFAFWVGTIASVASNQESTSLYKVNNPIRFDSSVPELPDEPSAYVDQRTVATLIDSCLQPHDLELAINLVTSWQKVNPETQEIVLIVPGTPLAILAQPSHKTTGACGDESKLVPVETEIPEGVTPGHWQVSSRITVINPQFVGEGQGIVDTEVSVSEPITLIER